VAIRALIIPDLRGLHRVRVSRPNTRSDLNLQLYWSLPLFSQSNFPHGSLGPNPEAVVCALLTKYPSLGDGSVLAICPEKDTRPNNVPR